MDVYLFVLYYTFVNCTANNFVLQFSFQLMTLPFRLMHLHFGVIKMQCNKKI